MNELSFWMAHQKQVCLLPDVLKSLTAIFDETFYLAKKFLFFIFRKALQHCPHVSIPFFFDLREHGLSLRSDG